MIASAVRTPIGSFRSSLCNVPAPRLGAIVVKAAVEKAGILVSRGGGDSHMKWTGMLVVSLRGVNFGFWSRLGCSGQNVIIFSRQGLV